jgi:predicted GNAT family acetyltransferase
MEIKFKIDDRQRGSFFIEEGGNQIAELDFELEGNVMNAYHTGVRKEYEGQGIAGKLFDALIVYAREHGYKIIPTCSYILAKFRRHPEDFEDIWLRTEDEPSGDACGLKSR